MNCIFAAQIEYRNISIQKNCQPVQNPLILYYPHAYPPPILSHPMHALPLFCPTPCMPSSYSIPSMHALPLFYPTSCIPSLLFYPRPCTVAHPSPILSQLMHTLSLFYSSLYIPYSIPPHTCPPLILSHCMHVLSCSLPAHSATPVFYFSSCMSS